jgi:hypothetical protein
MSGKKKCFNKGLFMLVVFLAGLVSLSFAQTSKYTGVATLKGKTVYTEVHELKYDEKKNILESTTTYTDASGKVAHLMVYQNGL